MTWMSCDWSSGAASLEIQRAFTAELFAVLSPDSPLHLGRCEQVNSALPKNLENLPGFPLPHGFFSSYSGLTRKWLHWLGIWCISMTLSRRVGPLWKCDWNQTKWMWKCSPKLPGLSWGESALFLSPQNWWHQYSHYKQWLFQCVSSFFWGLWEHCVVLKFSSFVPLHVKVQNKILHLCLSCPYSLN